MFLKNGWLVALSLSIIPSSGYPADPNYEVISRCFFVYAPIFETAKKLQNQPVFIYSQKRLSWAGGYIQSQQNNHVFKNIFESNLESNKKSGSAIEDRLTNAFRLEDAKEYEAVMNIARQCDKQLGLSSKDIPHP